MILSVGPLGWDENGKVRMRIEIDAQIVINGKAVKTKALLDSGAEVNVISQMFAVENDLPYADRQVSDLSGVGSKRVKSLGKLDLNIEATSTFGERHAVKQRFDAVEAEGYDLLLGFPWLEEANPLVDWKNRTWSYWTGQAHLLLEKPEAFVRHLEEGSQLYVMLPDGGDQTGAASGPRVRTLAAEQDLLPAYDDFKDVFSEDAAGILPETSEYDHAIDVAGGEQPPFGPLYSLSEKELSVLRQYLDSSLKKGWIRESQSPAGAPILFTPKEDGTLRLCVDYRGLNKITVKNRYPLPRIDEMLDRLSNSQIFTKIDLRDAYHRIRIKRGDEWKTAFRTRYGHFEYKVMPFGLTNAPATFQSYIHRALRGLIDVTCIVYLDDILIFSQDLESHQRAVREVLARLRKWALYAKRSKCHFHVSEVEFLGYIVGNRGVRMDASRVATVAEWPIPKSFHDVQVFLGFANFFRRFIYGYSRIARPLTGLLVGSVKGKKRGQFTWTDDAAQAFRALKTAFQEAPLLGHFDPSKPIRVDTDASMYAIAGVLLQPCGESADHKGQYRPVAYYSRKLIPAEVRYDIHDQELLALVDSFKHWRHYLEGSQFPIQAVTDHNNLRYFMTTKVLSRRQARYAEFLSSFDFEICYRPGKSNPADGPSRRPDYTVQLEDSASLMIPTLQQKLRGSLVSGLHQIDSDTIFPGGSRNTPPKDTASGAPTESQDVQNGGSIWKLQGESGAPSRIFMILNNGPVESQQAKRKGGFPLAGTDGLEHLVPRSFARLVASAETAVDAPSEPLTTTIKRLQQNDRFVEQNKWNAPLEKNDAGVEQVIWQRDDAGLLRHKGAIYVPRDEAIRAEILKIHHDAPHAGHLGVARTLELTRRKYFWPDMAKQIKEYVKSCAICQRTKVRRHQQYGQSQALPVPTAPWKHLSMDMIVGLPICKGKHGGVFDSILVIVDRFTKMVVYIAIRASLDASLLADIFFEKIILRFGVPNSIVSDRGSIFTSSFWTTLTSCLHIKRRLSTAFHPQTDGQTERQNQTLEQYLRCYINFRQDNWVDHLPMAEYVYNNSLHAATKLTPFFSLMGYDPSFEINAETDIPEGEAPLATERVKEIIAHREEAVVRLQEARASQERYVNAKHLPIQFRKGDKVMLKSQNIRTRRPSKKLDDKFLGPFEVDEPVGKQSYRLVLPEKYGRIHPVFHVSLLEPFVRRACETTPEPEDIDGGKEWQVEQILEQRKRNSRFEYLVRWQGFSPAEDSWQPVKNLTNCKDLIKEFKDKINSRAPVDKGSASGPQKRQRK